MHVCELLIPSRVQSALTPSNRQDYKTTTRAVPYIMISLSRHALRTQVCPCSSRSSWTSWMRFQKPCSTSSLTHEMDCLRFPHRGEYKIGSSRCPRFHHRSYEGIPTRQRLYEHHELSVSYKIFKLHWRRQPYVLTTISIVSSNSSLIMAIRASLLTNPDLSISPPNATNASRYSSPSLVGSSANSSFLIYVSTATSVCKSSLTAFRSLVI